MSFDIASRQAFAQLLPKLGEAQRATFATVESLTARLGRPLTARELEEHSGERKINARLSELERKGLLVKSDYLVKCTVTGRMAHVWRERTHEDPSPTVRGMTWKERGLLLESEVARLKFALHAAQRRVAMLEVLFSSKVE